MKKAKNLPANCLKLKISPSAQKFLLKAIQEATQKNDNGFEAYISDFKALLNDQDLEQTHTTTEKALEELARSNILIETLNEKVTGSIISKYVIDKTNGTVAIELNPAFNDAIREYFQSFDGPQELDDVLSLKGKYSHRLYNLLKDTTHDEEIAFDLEELKKNLEAETYPRFPDFKNRVLEPASADITLNTALKVTYRTTAYKRKVNQVIFKVRRLKGKIKQGFPE